ncbi:MAG: Ig-like domain-containing protein [Myxococcota bacterium]
MDVTPPFVAIAVPVVDALLTSGDVSVSGTAEVGAALTVAIDDAQQQQTTAAADGTWSVAFAGIADGPHTAAAAARDAVGNLGTASVAFSVDALTPTVSIDAPSDGAVTNVAAIVVRGSGKPGADVSLRHDGVDHAVVVSEAGAWSVDLGTVADGAWTDTATLTDEAQRTASAQVSYRVDTVAPALAIAAPAEGATVDVALPPSAAPASPGSRCR